MKRFKIGLLAVIALLVMGFTFISHNEVFKKNMPIDTCDQYVDVVGGSVYPNSVCSGTPQNLNCSTPVPSFFASAPQLQSASSFTCSGSGNVFCCVEITDATVQCPDDPFNFLYKVTKVICRNQ